MRIISGYFVYKTYITYKAHFSHSPTDISKYGFRPFNCSYDSFLNTRGQRYYDELAKKVKYESDLVSIFISAFMEDSSLWIGDICNNFIDYVKLKDKRESRIANMSYLFKRDCIYLLDEGMQFNDKMGVFVLDRFIQSNIEIETFIIFKKIFKFSLDKNTNYHYFYKGKYEKYELLLNIDKEKYKKILKEAIMASWG